VLVTSEVTIDGDRDVRGSLALLRILPVRPERSGAKRCRSFVSFRDRDGNGRGDHVVKRPRRVRSPALVRVVAPAG
jgi:hypothetical protein